MQAAARGDALDGRDCDVGGARGVVGAHFNIDMFVRVGTGAMAGGLLDKLTAVGEDEGLRGLA